MRSLTVFVAAWTALAAEGKCDELDSAECYRVLGEWIRARCPDDVAAFIVERANIGPTDQDADVHADLAPSGNGDDVEDPDSGVDLR